MAPARPLPRSLVAVAVVLVILLAWAVARQARWAHLDYWKAALVESPDEIYARGGGGPDAEAALALDRTELRLRNPRVAGIERAQDHHRAARILRHAFLPSMASQQAAAAQARIQHHERAMLEVLARAIPGEQRSQARRAHALRTAHRTAHRAGVAGHPRAPPGPGVEFMLAEARAARGQGAGDGFGPLRATAEVAALNSEERRHAAEAVTNTRAEAAQLYLDLAQAHTADGENSHDPAVVAGLRAIVDRLRADNHTATLAATLGPGDIAAAFAADLPTYTRDPRTGRSRPLLFTEAVLPVIERAGAGESVRGPDGWRITDADMLALVWARSHHPKNARAAADLRGNLFWALADAVSPGTGTRSTRCVQGRVTRMAGALALLDFDEDNWQLTRREDVHNEIMEGARRALQAAAERIAADEQEAPGARAAAAEIAQCEAPRGADASAADEQQVVQRLTAVMLAEADRQAAALNARSPGAAAPDFVADVKNELRFVL